MKRLLACAAAAMVSCLAFAQTAPQNQIDLGAGFYDTDPTGVYANFMKPANGQNAKYSPSLNWNGKYTFTLPLDASDTLKFAVADDGWYGLYTGSASNQAGESGQNAGLLTPAAEYLGYGADVTLSVPFYYYNPADAGGYNELKYAYKEAGYLPLNTANYPLNSADSLVTAINLKAFYKYSFDKTTWVQGGVALLYALSPTPWFTDILPKVSAGAFGAQLDLQYDYYNAYKDSSSAQYADNYLEPKLTYDLGFAKLVPGLKVYAQSRIALSTNNPAYVTPKSWPSNQPFHDTYIQPGVNYSYTVPKVGTFGIDAAWRFNKVDNVGTATSTDTQAYNGTASNVNDVAPYSDLRIALSYSYKF